ncbi:MAG TPA: hypothetical protein VH302_12105 [Bryobacteraceae bacterium]|jgi:cell division protein FtsI/penicillin-binding protein 2|nr:hypothetical protein [Bryobacteraceae bacterium]
MISRRGLLAVPFVAWAAKQTCGTEYLAVNLRNGNRVGQWEARDRAVSMGSLLKPFLVVAYGRTHSRFPNLVCRGEADRCWLPHGHGRQDVVMALANSCNFYFRHVAGELNRAALESVCLSYGLEGPADAITADELIGLRSGWPQRATAVLSAFARLAGEGSEPGVQLALAGMKRSAELGTARGLGLRARAKTGTAPCSHAPRSEGDGYAAVLYPLDQVRLVLLARQCGNTGAHAAQLAGPIVRKLV